MLKNKYRIAILSVHSSPLGQPGAGDTGGMSIYIRELSAELAKLGHTVDIFTRAQDPVTPEIMELTPGSRLIQIQAGEQEDIDKLLIYSHVPDFACKTATFAKQHSLSYDLIFSHYWLSGIAGEYLQTWWQVPQIVMFHTLGAIKNEIGIGEDEPDLRLDEERQVSGYCHLIIASTEHEKKALNRHYGVPPEKISVIPCGVNLDLFKPLDKSLARQKLGLTKEKIILFVGRVERLKGIDQILQALTCLAHIHPQLIIVGEDGNRPGEINNLKIRAGDLGISGSVAFTGLTDYKKLPYYYSAADVCVFPSYYESFGLVPLESLACGTPVVATDVGDLRNIILQGKTGYVLTDRQPEHLAEKIEAVLLGASPRMGDALSVRASVARYSWRNIALGVEHEFKKLTAGNRVRTCSSGDRLK
jgi:D-inositol-3-phosphate glycosyltransferase